MSLSRPRRRSKKNPPSLPATQEGSEMPSSIPCDPSTQLAESQSHNSRGWHWTDDQTLYFLQRLLEARRNGDLNVNKAGPVRDVLEGLIPGFQGKWSNISWEYETLKSKLRHLRDFWRAFRDGYDLSGGNYNPRTGRLEISRDNIKKLKERNPQHGKKVVEGLLIGPYITIDSWEEIFSNDPLAGRLIAAASDESVWAGHEAGGAEDRDSDAVMVDDDDQEAQEEVEDEIEVEDEVEDDMNDLPQSQVPDPLDLPDSLQLPASLLEEVDSQPIPAASHTPIRGVSPSSSRLRERQRIAISEYQPQASSSSRKKSKSAGSITAEELKELLHDDSHRSLSFSARPTGSEDLEKAVSNCLEIIGEAHGMPYAVRAIGLFKDVRNAVIWNALGSKEVKEAWVESEIGPAE